MLLTTEAWDKAVLTALGADANLQGSWPFMGLYVNHVQPSKTLTIADLIEASYPGYARSQASGAGVFLRNPLYGLNSLGNGIFVSPDPGTPAVVLQGLFLTFGPSDALMAIEPFPQPITLGDSDGGLFAFWQYFQSSEYQGFTKVLR